MVKPVNLDYSRVKDPSIRSQHLNSPKGVMDPAPNGKNRANPKHCGRERIQYWKVQDISSHPNHRGGLDDSKYPEPSSIGCALVRNALGLRGFYHLERGPLHPSGNSDAANELTDPSLGSSLN